MTSRTANKLGMLFHDDIRISAKSIDTKYEKNHSIVSAGKTKNNNNQD